MHEGAESRSVAACRETGYERRVSLETTPNRSDSATRAPRFGDEMATAAGVRENPSGRAYLESGRQDLNERLFA